MADVDPFSDPEERRVLFAALDSFRQYRQAAHYNITYLRRQSFYSLPNAQIELLSKPPFSFPETFDAVDDAIDTNADLAEAILRIGLAAFGLEAGDTSWKGRAKPHDMDKARSTIRQFYRDWTAEGAGERAVSFEPIFIALNSHLPTLPPSKLHRQSILVPGAGLGRLVFDLVEKGYTVEGNEISYHQLLASNYILNYAQKAGQHRLYPWALSFSNHLQRAHQLQGVEIPDLHPGSALELASQQSQAERHYSERMSMTAGDFCDIYQRSEYAASFTAVVTCFFIDTAPNFITYINTILHCLRPGGIWINVGPLLWHFESAPTPAEREKQNKQDTTPSRRATETTSSGIGEPGSFELSNEEVITLVTQLGFEIVEQRSSLDQPVGYIQDPNSMLANLYRPSFWVARKL